MGTEQQRIFDINEATRKLVHSGVLKVRKEFDRHAEVGLTAFIDKWETYEASVFCADSLS